MTSKLSYTRAEYESIYESSNKSAFDLDQLTNPLVISKNRGIVLQSHINKIDLSLIHFIYTNDGSNIDVYSDHKEMLEDVVKYIKNEIKKEIKKMPLISNHLIKLINYEVDIMKKKCMVKDSSLKKNLPGVDNSKRSIQYMLARNTSKCFSNIISNLPSLIDKLTNQDTLKHIKNFNINFQDLDTKLDMKSDVASLEKGDSNEFLLDKLLANHIEVKLNNVDYNSIEEMDDQLKEIILIQKTKKLIQKTFSSKYKDLINEDTFDLMKELVMRDVDKTTLHDNFAKKMARYKSAEEFNLELRKYIQQSQGWSIDQYIKKANDLGVKIIHNEDNVLTLKIDSYEQSNTIGSQQWCISYDDHYFHSYHKKGGMFFFYDFNKDIDDNSSMLGMIINKDNEMVDGYWKDDTDFNDGLERDEHMFDNYIPALPAMDQDEYTQYIWDYVSKIEKDHDRNNMLLSEFGHVEFAPYIKRAIDENLLNNMETNILMDFIELGYAFDNEKECRDEWKEVVKEILKNKRDRLIETIPLIKSVFETEDLELIDLYCKVTKIEKTLSYPQYIWDYISKIEMDEYRNVLLMSEYGKLESAEYFQKAIDEKLIKKVESSMLINLMDLGYGLGDEPEHRDNWKNIVKEIVNNEELITKDTLIKESPLIKNVLHTKDLDLLDLYCKRAKGDEKTLSFANNQFVWTVINMIKNKENTNDENSYDVIIPIVKVLEKNNFKFSLEDIKYIEEWINDDIERCNEDLKNHNKVTSEAIKESGGVVYPGQMNKINEEVQHFNKEIAISKENLMGFKKIIEQHNFKPNKKKAKINKLK